MSWKFVCPKCGETNKAKSLPHSNLCGDCYWKVMKGLIEEERKLVPCEKCGMYYTIGDWPHCPHGKDVNYSWHFGANAKR